ncbi:MAG: ABC transporter permease subunit [Treponema sp.]|jgi:ABC-type Na+ efflux pump permease subunit|nr:ABC transporter permease subunit [Treponema sp.]
MINDKQIAIIKKDIKGITANKRMMTALIIVPAMMAVVMPAIFILTVVFVPEDSPDMMEMMTLLGSTALTESRNIQQMLINMILNYIIPLFFLLIPIMASSVMASSSFVGEKEKKTLETLLYSPLSLKEIFNAKILASFLLSMAVSILSFIAMLIFFETLLFILTNEFIWPNSNWLIMMLLVSPAMALISINIIVRGSAKSQTSEEAQQSSLFLVLPVILLITGQFTGIMMLGPHIFLILGAVTALIAVLLFRGSFGSYDYEKLLR